MPVKVSVLTPRELEFHDALIQLLDGMGKLSFQSRRKIYERWVMLSILTLKGTVQFESNLVRVNTPYIEVG